MLLEIFIAFNKIIDPKLNHVYLNSPLLVVRTVFNALGDVTNIVFPDTVPD